jgi:UDP-N-acetylglucosamine acyltransferase
LSGAAVQDQGSVSMSVSIHPMSLVDPKAQLGAGVTIGPFCQVGPDVVLGEGVELVSHAVVAGRTTIGPRTRIFPFASIGHPPQDVKYRGEPSTLTIGEDCQIREGVTMNPGTEGGGMITSVGDRCFFLANSHVGHDSRLGNNIIFSNNVMCAGHVTIGNFVIVGGGAGLQQFIRIGDHAFIGGGAGVLSDVIPFGTIRDNPAHLVGLNLIGLKRRGFTREQIHELRRAYRLLFAAEGTLTERVEDVAAEFSEDPLVHEILNFIREGGDKALCTPRDATVAER